MFIPINYSTFYPLFFYENIGSGHFDENTKYFKCTSGGGVTYHDLSTLLKESINESCMSMCAW